MKLDRRMFIIGGAALTSIPSVARAEMQCTQFTSNGVQFCDVGIPTFRLISARQVCPQWCWAASVQMVFALGGHLLLQEQIVERLYSDLRCSAANGPQIVETVNSGPWVDSSGQPFSARAYPLADFDFGYGNLNAVSEAADHLAAGIPLITGALGHATVMTAMTFYRDVYGRGKVQSITVRDPWPGNPPRRTLSAEEAYGTRLLVAIR